MTNENGGAAGRLLSIALTTCSGATTVAMTARLTASEEERLRWLLRGLDGFGLILPFAVSAWPEALGYGRVVQLIADAVGRHFVEAALAAGEPACVGEGPDPVAAVPIWAFEPEHGSPDVLVSSARLWGVDLFVEALRVEDDETGLPVAAVRARHARWLAAAGARRPVRAARLTGWPGSYAVFAAAAPI